MSSKPLAVKSAVFSSVDRGICRKGRARQLDDVEDAFYLHPAVRECVVLRHPTQANEVLVFVSLRAELAGREQALRDWARWRIDACTTSQRIVVLCELPRGPDGRVDRSSLQDLAVSLETGIEVVS
jgi:acyl-coenzyme A synthetase/AMP-(fatty) acid ligase